MLTLVLIARSSRAATIGWLDSFVKYLSCFHSFVAPWLAFIASIGWIAGKLQMALLIFDHWWFGSISTLTICLQGSYLIIDDLVLLVPSPYVCRTHSYLWVKFCYSYLLKKLILITKSIGIWARLGVPVAIQYFHIALCLLD